MTTTQLGRRDAEDDFRVCAVSILTLQGSDEYSRAYRHRRRELLSAEGARAAA